MLSFLWSPDSRVVSLSKMAAFSVKTSLFPGGMFAILPDTRDWLFSSSADSCQRSLGKYKTLPFLGGGMVSEAGTARNE